MSSPPPEIAKVAVAMVLTFVAGYVDVLGWLAFNHVFLAHMSGNTALVAIRLAAGQRGAALYQAFIIGMFFLGLVIGGAVIEFGMRRRQRRILAATLLIEFVLLAIFTVGGQEMLKHGGGTLRYPSGADFIFGAMVAFAMGAQNTSLRTAGVLGAYTTHVTGTITNLGEEAVVAIFRLVERAIRAPGAGRFAAGNLQARQPVMPRHIGRSVGLLAGFFGGALVAAFLVRALDGPAIMAIPLALVLAIGVFDLARPLTQIPGPPPAGNFPPPPSDRD